MTIDERIDKYVMPEPNTGCWLWSGCINKNGYGILKMNNKVSLAHRIIYEHIAGKIPENLLACHHCDTPSCVNPDHIFIGTNKDNSNDRDRKKRLHIKIGVINGRALFDNSQVLAIKDASKMGHKRRHIAKYFNNRFAAIDDIIYNRRWKHIL